MKLIGLDVGTKRIGVAKADSTTKIAVPDGFINVNGQEFAEIARLARLYSTTTFIVGLPRNNSGEETRQSLYVRQFARQLAMSIPNARIYFEDESLTSVEAEKRLKARKKNFEKGEIDAEAATIILQDFLERLITSGKIIATAYTSNQAKTENDAENITKTDQNTLKKMPKKSSSNQKPKLLKKLLMLFIGLILLGGIAFGGAYYWYVGELKPRISDPDCTKYLYQVVKTEATKNNYTEGPCAYESFEVKDNDTVSAIATNLKNSGLIRSDLAFKIYVKLNKSNLKFGVYKLSSSMSVSDIVKTLANGSANENVFNITILPGETVADIKKKLEKIGYSPEQINEAFEKPYENKIMPNFYDANGNLSFLDQPRAVQLEGYLFGDTYQFYKGESLEKVLNTMINALGDVVASKNLEARFLEKGLTLRQGIILASIVQKEAKAPDMNGVAQVFLNRIRRGMSLGSDVTATYAANLVDPERKLLKSNAEVLIHDSLYNTRFHTGLPPGPISNPGVNALEAVATGDESKRSTLFCLTGDDGKMYYSDTEAGHNQNIRNHCQTLCGVSL